MYGPVRTVVWQGAAGDRRPYADQVGQGSAIRSLQGETDFKWRQQAPAVVFTEFRPMVDPPVHYTAISHTPEFIRFGVEHRELCCVGSYVV